MRFRDVSLTGIGALAIALVATNPAAAGSIIDSNLGVTNGMATASGSSSRLGGEIEAADDFILNTSFSLTSASFIGLIPAGVDLNVEIHRVFPADIVGGATPPTFNMAFQLEAVPEPASLVLLSAGLIVCAWRLRHRSHRPPQPRL